MDIPGSFPTCVSDPITNADPTSDPISDSVDVDDNDDDDAAAVNAKWPYRSSPHIL